MFGNTDAYKRIMKKKLLMDALEKAKEEGNEWKIRQAQGKLDCYNKKYYPNMIWDSNNGAYRKGNK